jgi:streptomycin 6-kinase
MNINELKNKWRLTELKIISNNQHRYILSGLQNDKPIILKLSNNIDSCEKEVLALNYFSNFGAIKILAATNNAILMEQAGSSLKSYFPQKDQDAVIICCDIIKKLHTSQITNDVFPNIKDWLSILNKDYNMPINYLSKARTLRDRLLSITNENILLHGDLHHENILYHNNNWVFIDPKGVIGNIYFEATTFIYNPITELTNSNNCEEIMLNRIKLCTKLLNLDKQKLIEWCFLKLVLCWVWNIEDGVNTSDFKKLTNIVYILL